MSLVSPQTLQKWNTGVFKVPAKVIAGLCPDHILIIAPVIHSLGRWHDGW